MGLEGQGKDLPGKRTVWCKKTGDKATIYDIDARERLRRGDWVSHPDLLPQKTKDLLAAKGIVKMTPEELAAKKDKADKANKAAKDREDIAASGNEEPFENKDGGEFENDNDGSMDDDEPRSNIATWENWNDAELLAKAKELGIRNAKNKDREKLVEALTGKGVVPADDKASME